MAPRRECLVCGSRQWHKEPQSGVVTCSEGHVLQNYRNESSAREITEIGPHAVHKRTLNKRQKKQKLSKADPKFYHGERARFHYFQCLQLILCMQVEAITRIWELPPEFETVCRELWALHLSLLSSPPIAESLLHLQGKEGAGANGSQTRQPKEGDTPQGRDSDSKSDEGSAQNVSLGSSSSSSESVSEESDRDDDLEALMRENSESSSTDEEESAEERAQRKDSESMRRKARQFVQSDAPVSTLSILVVACWTLRIPVMYNDLLRLVEGYEVPYLDTLRLLSESMTSHLTRQTTQALSPNHVPSTLSLHHLCSRLGRLLYASYGILTPEMNAAPILWRAVRSLQGTPVLYALAKRLAHILSIPLTLHRSLSPALMKQKKRDPTYHIHDSAVPEVALIACAIVVLKLVYGLDGNARRPSEPEDPANALPTLSELLAAIREAELEEAKHPTPASMGTSTSALDMDGAMMDAYLDFCQRALLPREDRMPGMLYNFPLCEGVGNATTSRNKKPEEAQPRQPYVPNAVPSEDPSEVPRKPGEQYTIYHTQDILGTLPEDLELVVSSAARWAGVDVLYVSGVVERVERRFEIWWETLRKRERRAELENAKTVDAR
ncbi:uncharacterized protein BXZ73DRAFT_40601 [Epithele typhae]|uniref:uncharacterized protein n=1 Tax=Epithele typhae TaxID=378194 RepID=UPI00200817E0|nr:uncharacterized protein BXZ73DRAFT_40601 [Epithele typhae]KAH9943461.1 hypothetical protein BXZ73DRAFT_40601 [Epithele typhae]